MVTVKFAATQQADGSERIQLVEQLTAGLFKKASAQPIAVSDWPRMAPESGLAALATARASAEEHDVVEEDQCVILSARAAAALAEADAHSLGLPPATAFTLQLRSSGSLVEGTISVETKWLRRGGAPVRADPLGARVKDGGSTSRIVEPMFSVLQAARKVANADTPEGRRSAFAELREALGDDIASSIDVDGFIERIRIAYAANFSLDAKTSDGRFDFDPVLFARQANETEDGDLLDEKEASLLTPNDNLFFQTRFRNQDGSRKNYLLPDGTLLFLDPLLARALAVVREKQRAPSADRREFLRSPQRVLREALHLDADGDDAAADRLFIETRQFSERVSGIEVWQKPVLPWIKPTPNSWLPEGYGLRIGDPPDAKYLTLEPGDAERITTAVEEAIQRGDESIVWNESEIPASQETLKAAKGLIDLGHSVADSVRTDASEGPAEPLPTFFLQVGQNFETLDFARLPHRAAAKASYAAPSWPDGIRSSPKAHQKTAFAWLAEAWDSKVPGVLLADDMGLGKTFQALTFMRWLRTQAAPGRPILIVAPTGLLRNWQAEIAQHLEPRALGPVVEAFGNSLSQFRDGPGNDIRGGTSRLNVDGWDEAGVILTTYETMRDYHMSFARVRFSVIVYDEIQKLKNPASQMTRAAKALNADFQIAMTGTPVENRLQDLWSIADTVYPGFLGTSRDFERSYNASNLERLADLQSLLVDRDGALPAFMLRRMKDEILTGLPAKQARKYSVEMPHEQATAYDQVLARARALRQSGERGAMLKVLHMLRGTSLHPHPPRGVQDIQTYIGQSARLKKTFDLLHEIKAAGEKALVFCEDLEMQSFLAMAIQERFEMQHRPMCINGNVAGPKRQEMVNVFQTRPAGFDVMILSPKAGGVGLTITAANHVIHLSRWWNPAVEDQATDRVYRIGQQRPVTVHIPVATHPDPAIAPSSFDKRLDDLMERKRGVSRGLLMPPEGESDVEELLADVLDGDRAAPEPVAPQESVDGAIQAADGLSTSEQDGSSRSAPPVHPVLGEEQWPPSSPADQPIASRPILTVVETPIEAGERRAPEIRRVVFEEYGPRDWSIFEQYLKGAEIERLEIQDPYCCSGDPPRSRLVNFVKRFADHAAAISEVHVLALDGESTGDQRPEATRCQRDDLESRWKSTLRNIELHLVQRSKRAAGDIHDRFVRAHFRNGDSVIWDLGRGIDGVMSARWSCVVNAFHQPSSVH